MKMGLMIALVTVAMFAIVGCSSVKTAAPAPKAAAAPAVVVVPVAPVVAPAAK